MVLEKLPHDLTVCKTASIGEIDLDAGFFFIGRTDSEISLVCLTSDVPEGAVDREDGWRGFRVRGPLDFSLTGVLAELSGILADHGIPIFAVSTFDTDYILVKAGDLDRASGALKQAGHEIR